MHQRRHEQAPGPVVDPPHQHAVGRQLPHETEDAVRGQEERQRQLPHVRAGDPRGGHQVVPHPPEDAHDQPRGQDAVAPPQAGGGEPRPAELLAEAPQEPGRDGGQQEGRPVARGEDARQVGRRGAREGEQDRGPQERGGQERDRVPARAHAPPEQPGAQLADSPPVHRGGRSARGPRRGGRAPTSGRRTRSGARSAPGCPGCCRVRRSTGGRRPRRWRTRGRSRPAPGAARMNAMRVVRHGAPERGGVGTAVPDWVGAVVVAMGRPPVSRIVAPPGCGQGCGWQTEGQPCPDPLGLSRWWRVLAG